jgi:hypothetical protein
VAGICTVRYSKYVKDSAMHWQEFYCHGSDNISALTKQGYVMHLRRQLTIDQKLHPEETEISKVTVTLIQRMKERNVRW